MSVADNFSLKLKHILNFILDRKSLS